MKCPLCKHPMTREELMDKKGNIILGDWWCDCDYMGVAHFVKAK